MSLSEEERTTLVRYQLEKARSTMHEAEALISSDLWNGAANRLYYSIFHAVSALLIHDRHQVNTHKALTPYSDCITLKQVKYLQNMDDCTVNFKPFVTKATIIVYMM
ncbi:MAG: HEPN domain-containing protein [Bacteroidales bacterium]|nr:HEPN domain-containing protein [Bacteroidales bacterium]